MTDLQSTNQEKEALSPARMSGELVIGLIAPVGTNIDGVRDAFKSALEVAGYDQIHYRLSEVFRERLQGIDPVDASSEFFRVWTSMDAGDRLRSLTRRDDIVSLPQLRKTHCCSRGLRGRICRTLPQESSA